MDVYPRYPKIHNSIFKIQKILNIILIIENNIGKYLIHNITDL